MMTITFSNEIARQFALDIYDQFILDIKEQEENEFSTDAQNCEEGRAA